MISFNNISKMIQKLSANDEFSGSILVSKNSEIVYSEAYGLSCKSFNIPNKLNTKHNIASIGKIFTGTAVTQLVQNGLLSFDDAVSNYIDNSFIREEIASKIKIKHLLTHTSGLGDYFHTAYSKSYRTEIRNLIDYIDLLKDSRLSFTPGSQWSYSNSGFVLLGFIIENISKMSFYDYIDRNIFKVCGMINSSYLCEDEPATDKATGYYKVNLCDGNSVYRSNLRKPVIKGSPSGGCYSTVTDLFNYINALLNNKLLDEKYTNEVLSPKPEVASPGYGYGFFVDENTFGHSGDGTGVSAILQHYKKSGYTVIILSNYSNPSASNAYDLLCKELI